MVDNIIELVNARSKKDGEWVEFVEQKYKLGRVGFDQAIHLAE
jgi:hypothetical protein